MARRPGFLASLALAAIRGYQRHLSPHKGFSCAYRCATGRASCSAHGYRAIERFGVWSGLALLRRRLRLCGAAYRGRIKAVPNPKLHYQRGDCVPCDCDAGCVPDLAWADACQCGDCGDCKDLRRWWRNRREQRRLRRQRRMFS